MIDLIEIVSFFLNTLTNILTFPVLCAFHSPKNKIVPGLNSIRIILIISVTGGQQQEQIGGKHENGRKR